MVQRMYYLVKLELMMIICMVGVDREAFLKFGWCRSKPGSSTNHILAQEWCSFFSCESFRPWNPLCSISPRSIAFVLSIKHSTTSKQQQQQQKYQDIIIIILLLSLINANLRGKVFVGIKMTSNQKLVQVTSEGRGIRKIFTLKIQVNWWSDHTYEVISVTK